MTDSPVGEVRACQTRSRTCWETPKKVPNLLLESRSRRRCLSFEESIVLAVVDFLGLVLLDDAGEDFIGHRRIGEDKTSNSSCLMDSLRYKCSPCHASELCRQALRAVFSGGNIFAFRNIPQGNKIFKKNIEIPRKNMLWSFACVGLYVIV